MAYNESGHAMNASAFNQLNVEVNALGEAYQPSNMEISVDALNTKNEAIEEGMQVVKDAESILSNLVKRRQLAFAPLRTLSTRIIGVVDSTTIIPSKKSEMRALVEKIRGDGRRKSDNPQYSTSQMSYVMRIDNLIKLITLLEKSPEYNPAVEDLTIISLKALAQDLKGQKDSIDLAEADLKRARNTRDNLLYADEIGASDLLKKVKSYLKSWPEGTKGVDYQRINGISIRKRK